MNKRLFDLVVTIVLLVPSLALVTIFAVIILIVHRCSPIFFQSRVGTNKIHFRLVKLRTMKKGTENLGTHLVDQNSVTTIGKIARKYKVDELPQLYSVLKGDMSLVGPRPCLPNQFQVIDEREKLGVFKLRPGITGMAQINGVDMSTPELLASLDNDYAEISGFFTDIKIMLKTFSYLSLRDRVV